MKSLSEMARSCVCPALGRDERAAFNQLRGLQQRGHLRAFGVVDGVQTYSYREEIIARILMDALDADVRGADVTLVEELLREGCHLAEPLDRFGDINLDANIRRTLRGEDWLIEISRHRLDGEKIATAEWVRRDRLGRIERFPGRYLDRPEIANLTRPRARLLLEVSTIVQPLISDEL